MTEATRVPGRLNKTEGQGASMDAIGSHYDVGNDFYSLWLDESMTYSCALFEGEDDTLEAAQKRKLDYHIREARAEHAPRVLDIGCGWGSVLSRLAGREGGQRSVGLTLSRAQRQYIETLNLPDTEIRLESWADHRPDEPYDAIISIGALEHFVRPETPHDERIAIYRHFFECCRRMLRPGGHLSLQTMGYGVGSFVKGALSTIFPESDLPRLAQLAEACEKTFELRTLRNDPEHYARTVRHWAERLKKNHALAVQVAPPERVQHFEKFLDAGARGYDARIFHLYRITLRRLDADFA